MLRLRAYCLWIWILARPLGFFNFAEFAGAQIYFAHAPPFSTAAKKTDRLRPFLCGDLKRQCSLDSWQMHYELEMESVHANGAIGRSRRRACELLSAETYYEIATCIRD